MDVENDKVYILSHSNSNIGCEFDLETICQNKKLL